MGRRGRGGGGDEEEKKIIFLSRQGRRVNGICGSVICSGTLMELLFKPCSEFRWSPEGPVNQIHSPHLHAGTPRIFSHLLRSVQMLKREWGAESNGKLLHLFIPIKLQPWFPCLQWKTCFGQNCSLGAWVSVKYLPLGRALWRWWWCPESYNNNHP